MSEKQNKLIEEITDLAIEKMNKWPSSRNRQKQFILAYVANGFTNASEACRNAGYSKNSANNTANKMLKGTHKFPHIPPVIKYLKKAYEERSTELSIATGTEVLQHLTKVMDRQEDEYTVVVLKKREEKWIEMEDGSLKKQAKEYEEPSVVSMPTKVSDTNKAAELLGKYHKLWTEKTEMTGNVGLIQIVDDIPGENYADNEAD